MLALTDEGIARIAIAATWMPASARVELSPAVRGGGGGRSEQLHHYRKMLFQGWNSTVAKTIARRGEISALPREP
jgi:hypothetical protein